MNGSYSQRILLRVVLVPPHDESVVREILGYGEEDLEGTDDLNAEDVLALVMQHLEDFP